MCSKPDRQRRRAGLPAPVCLRQKALEALFLGGAFVCLVGCVDVRRVEEVTSSSSEPDAQDGGDDGSLDADVRPTPNDAASTAHSSDGNATAESKTMPDSAVVDAGADEPSGADASDASSSPVELAVVFARGKSTPLGGAAVGANGAQFYDNLCPRDEVLTGLHVWLRADATSSRYLAPMGLAAICSSMDVNPTARGWELELVNRRELPRRGVGFEGDTDVLEVCPPGSVVVGIGGLTGTYVGTDDAAVNYVDAVRLLCAPITVDVDGALNIGDSEAGQTLGTEQHAFAQSFEYQCPTSGIARGLAVASGSWLDSLGVVCSNARLARAEESPCDVDSDCATNVCTQGYCAEQECHTSDCSCSRYGDEVYAFCGLADWQEADAACRNEGQTLVWLTDPEESAWVRGTADSFGLGDVWLGANDLQYEGAWQWTSGETFWVDGAGVEGAHAQWASGEPNSASESDDCAVAREQDGLWSALECAQRRSFVCKR